MPNWKKLIVSGSSANLSNLTVDNAVTASFFKGDGSGLTNLPGTTFSNTVTSSFSSTGSVTIFHNFESKNVSVSVYNDSDVLIIPDVVTLLDNNNVKIDFAGNTSGFAVVAKGGHLVSGSVDFSHVTNKPTLISSSAQLANQTIPGDLTVTGTVTAQEFHTEYVSSSIIYQSGSTKFGDTLDDVHEFTGSVLTAGNAVITSVNENILQLKNSNSQPALIRFNDTSTSNDPYVGSYGNELAFGIYGVGESMRIDSSRRVGIGGSPLASARLSVRGLTNTSADYAFEAANSSGNSLLLVRSDGNVGIGTNSPTAKLDVNSGATNTVAAFRSTDSGAYIGMADPSTTLDAGYPTLSIGAVGNDLTLNTSNTERLRIDSGGNVGIGTTSPTRKLHVEEATTWLGRFAYNANNYVDIRYDGFNVAGGDMVFQNAGSERMRITSGGNVGIGTTTPISDAKLHLSNAGAEGLEFAVNITTNTNRILSYNRNTSAYNILRLDASELQFYTNGGGERMRIDSSGNVGIGTTSPSEILHINKNNAGNVVGAYLTNSQANTGAESVSLAFGLNRSGGDFVRQIKAITFGAEQQWTGTPSTVDGYLSFSTVQDETVSERMRIQADGNTKISFNPGSGNIYFHDSTNGASMFYIQPATYTGTSPFNTNVLQAANSSHIGFTTGGASRMVVDSSGFITTNPSANIQGALVAKGVEYSFKSVGSQTGYTQGAILLSSGTDSVPGARGQGVFLFNEANDITWYIGGLYNASDRIDFCRKTSTTSVDTSTAQSTYSLFNFNSSGQAYNATGTWGTISSDQRLKENIVDATPKLDDVMSLQVRNFNYIGKEEKYIGFIAQELEQVFPSLVTTHDMREFDRDGNVIGGLEDTKGVKVGMDFAILVKAIQEQQAIIEDLKARIETLEGS